jgi:hypothetical protein
MAPQPIETTKRKANSTKHLVEKNTDLIDSDVMPFILYTRPEKMQGPVGSLRPYAGVVSSSNAVSKEYRVPGVK